MSGLDKDKLSIYSNAARDLRSFVDSYADIRDDLAMCHMNIAEMEDIIDKLNEDVRDYKMANLSQANLIAVLRRYIGAARAELLRLGATGSAAALNSALALDPDSVKSLRGKCNCGDREKDKCPGEWVPGCSFGANVEYAKSVALAVLECERLSGTCSRIHDSEDPCDDPTECVRRAEAAEKQLDLGL